MVGMVGLGKPIWVCPNHIRALDCLRLCLGVELDNIREPQAATCAVCGCSWGRLRPFRILRKCHHPRCHSRFHQISYDELHIGDWLGFWARWPRRLVRFYDAHRRGRAA